MEIFGIEFEASLKGDAVWKRRFADQTSEKNFSKKFDEAKKAVLK